MNKQFLYFTAFCLITSLNAQDASMKQAKKEAKKVANEQMSHLKDQLSKDKLNFSEQDVLPEEDQGRKFDAKTADKQFNHAQDHAGTSELNRFLKTTQKPSLLDANEDFLVQGHSIIQDPNSSLELKTINTMTTPEEESIETCQEAGTYQIDFEQHLIVQATPAIKQSIKHCKGHQGSKSHSNPTSAKEHVSSKKEQFKKDPTLTSYEVHRNESKVSWSWTHKDNIATCDNYALEKQVLQEGSETESWETDQAESLQTVESNPSCKLLFSKILKGPETHIINGKSVHRDIWARQLLFLCEPDSDSKCATLRKQGAVLVSKKCLDTNVFGECDEWEKSYDLGKKGAFQQTVADFEKEALWGIQNEFNNVYEKSIDFGQTLATLSAFSEMEHTLETRGETQSSDFHDKVQIFKGENLKCQKSFLEGSVFDCCKKMEGVAVNIKLASCKSEEKCLAKYRHEGKCHFVGSQKVKLGTVTEHVYCCFPSKLARILHEHGRQQLGIKWGKAEKPKCRGLTLDELQKIDFSKIDLSEVIEDIKVDKTSLTKKLEQSIGSLQAQVQSQIEQKRKEQQRDNPNHTSEYLASPGDHYE